MSNTELLHKYNETRALSVDLCRPLRAEDYRVQSMPDVSPPWWNLGHTTWFFAKNVLEPRGLYDDEDRRFEYVLNSYYEALGPRIPRAERGLCTRPTTEEMLDFRQRVDARIRDLLNGPESHDAEELAFLVETGIQHEQQHQELLVTEVKHILGRNVREMREPYSNGDFALLERSDTPRWLSFDGGLAEFGNVGGGWCFDNEMPVHRSFLESYELSSHLVTCGEFQAFMADGGYEQPLLWMANGWAWRQEQGWQAPLYWEQVEGAWTLWSLAGNRSISSDEPLCHVSFYEADAYARWKGTTDSEWRGARLPTEREWEAAARAAAFDAASGTFLEDRRLHPASANGASVNGSILQSAGEVWEWTSSHYEPYPGYAPFDGNLMEYNSKFMDNQRVLRGGSCATPRSHIRVSYRNFWPPETRFQFTGLRLARSRS